MIQTIKFAGGVVEVNDNPTRKFSTVTVYGIADCTQQPGIAGTGPVGN